MLRLTSAVLGVLLFSPAMAEDGDPVAEKLASARQTYQQVMDKTDTTISAMLDRAEKQAQVSGGPLALQLVQFQRHRYENYGTTPRLCPASLLRQRSSASEKLLKTFHIAVNDYRKANKEGNALEVQLEARKYWPEFMDDPAYGGLKPFGKTSMEMYNGYLSITGTGSKAGVVSGRTDLGSSRLTLELCASEDIEAWIGVRVSAKKGKVSGHMSAIKITESGIAAGHSSYGSFRTGEIGIKGGSRVRQPNQIFRLHFYFKGQSLWAKMDGKVTSGVQYGRDPDGGFGIFVSRGTLIVKSVSLD